MYNIRHRCIRSVPDLWVSVVAGVPSNKHLLPLSYNTDLSHHITRSNLGLLQAFMLEIFIDKHCKPVGQGAEIKATQAR